MKLNLTKLCHITVGQKIKLTKDGIVQSEVFLVAAKPRPDAPVRVEGKRSSLSYEKAPVFLVSMATGETHKLPPMATLVALVADEPEQVTVNEPTPTPAPLPQLIMLPGPVLSDERIAACAQILEQNRRDSWHTPAFAA